MAPRLCLNMIVKNEAAILERCLRALTPYISAWVVADMGSSDETGPFVERWFAAHGIPGTLHHLPFQDFSQARNAALDLARRSPLAFDYLLLVDADMEMEVSDPSFVGRLHGGAYLVEQHHEVTYWNVRLLHRACLARYVGVTHEYLDLPTPAERLDGVRFRDWADGANRHDKFARDIALLTEEVRREPGDARSWFYLAQSYRDAGRDTEAAAAYARRVALGGWEEEVWTAQLELARCLLRMSDEEGFVREAMASWRRRPWRAEPAYELARYFRRMGRYDDAARWATLGLQVPLPSNELLFVERPVYAWGLREEMAISGFYTGTVNGVAAGRYACEELSLSRDVPPPTRDLARSNAFFYVESASRLLPSLEPRPIRWRAPPGYLPTNPSVLADGDSLVVLMRCVNYVISATGGYRVQGPSVHTRNFLLRATPDGRVISAEELRPPIDLPERSSSVLGLEDGRLFRWRGQLWISATVRQLNLQARAEMVVARVERTGDGGLSLTAWRRLTCSQLRGSVEAPLSPLRDEKNWIPMVEGDQLRFVHSCDPARIVDECGRTVREARPALAIEHLRGGSQAVRVGSGWLVLVHEVCDHAGLRHYFHRFALLDRLGVVEALGPCFRFGRDRIEFVAGADRMPGGRLVISFGVGDREAWLATVSEAEVLALLGGRRPPGSPDPGSDEGASSEGVDLPVSGEPHRARARGRVQPPAFTETAPPPRTRRGPPVRPGAGPG